MKRILITGGAGFIGTNLIQQITEDQVVAIDNLDPYYSIALKLKNVQTIKDQTNVEFIQTSLNSHRIEELFQEHKFDTVIHLAAKAGVRQSILNPVHYYRENIVNLGILLEYCRKYEVKKFIFASSSSIYGAQRVIPYTEDLQSMPISPYAATKTAGEALIYNYAYNYEIECKCLRFFTVYGPRQRPAMAISNFINNALNKKPITIFGDGSILRDFTYVSDIVQGILNCVLYSNPNKFECINLGGGKPVTINTLVELLEEITGVQIKVNYEENAIGDMPITYSNLEKAQNLIGYQPTIPLKEGLIKTIEWIVANEYY